MPPDVRFEIPDCPEEAVGRLRRDLGVSGALAQVLVRRGHADPRAARSFLAADERHDPYAFAGIETAVEAILAHVRDGGLITVHGDYDVDGICSTAVLVRTLRGLGADVEHFIPDRAEGYGLSEGTVRRLAERGTRLLLTADCAITAVEEVRQALELGVAVVVTDHHSPRADGQLPAAPIVHPGVCGYPCPDLCAAAVAHKLCQALLAGAGQRGLAGARQLAWVRSRLLEDFDLVALASIADVVALQGENRRLVRRGLRALARTAKPGLRALMAVSGTDPARVDERAVGFALAPRLNAAGRLYRADAGLELILTEDQARAAEIARELDSANSERRQVELGIRLEAEAQMDALGERPAYVLAGESWHPGVIGIVASRLVERCGRPVVLVACDGERGRGSGRSPAGYDLLAGLTACAQHLLRFGGHAAAAGVEVERGCLDALASALAGHARAAMAEQDLAPVERVDAVLEGEELDMALAEELCALAPYGRGNPPARLMLAEATFEQARSMGEGRHVRFTVRSPRATARAVAFGIGARLPVAEGERVQATFSLEVNEWNGVSEPRLVLRRAAPAGQPAPTPATATAVLAGGPRETRPPHAAPDGELQLFAVPR